MAELTSYVFNYTFIKTAGDRKTGTCSMFATCSIFADSLLEACKLFEKNNKDMYIPENGRIIKVEVKELKGLSNLP